MLRNDKPRPITARNEHDRGPADRTAPAGARLAVHHAQPELHPRASTSRDCRFARATNAAWLDATLPSIPYSSAALHNAIVARNTRDLTPATRSEERPARKAC